MVCNLLHININSLVTFILLIFLATDYESITTAVTAIFDIANSMFTIDPQPLVTVTIVNDDVPEDDEDFTLVLTPFFANRISLGVVSANPNVSRVIIRNDDGKNSKCEQPPIFIT